MKKSYDFSRAVKNPYLKRILVSVKIENVCDDAKGLSCDGVRGYRRLDDDVAGGLEG
jgi:hypothetical protein